MLTKQQILDRIGQAEPMLRELGVAKLELFGSYAHDQARHDSDVDLLVEFDEPRLFAEHRQRLTLFHIARVQTLLEDLLGREVDLVLKDCVYPPLRPRIYQEAVRVA